MAAKIAPGFPNFAPRPIGSRKRRQKPLDRRQALGDHAKHADEKSHRCGIREMMSQPPGTLPDLVLRCPGNGLQGVLERASGLGLVGLGHVRVPGGLWEALGAREER